MPYSFAFIDESGIAENSEQPQPFFGLGLVKVKDTSAITEALLTEHYNVYSQQRAQRRSFLKELEAQDQPVTQREISLLLSTTHHHEYKFTKVTWKNLERYKAFIDAAFAFPIHFSVIVVDKSKSPRFQKEDVHHYWDACIDYSKRLCDKSVSFREKLSVVVDYMCRPKSSDRLFEVELGKAKSVSNVIRSQSIAFPLLQLSDLLLGVTLHQWKQAAGYVQDSNRSRCKQAFVDHVMSYLQIPKNRQAKYPLAQAVTVKKDVYFRVIPLK